MNDEIGVGNIASKSDESTGLIIDCQSFKWKMYPARKDVWGHCCHLSLWTQLFHVKSILHANPLSTKNGMSIVQDQ